MNVYLAAITSDIGQLFDADNISEPVNPNN